jgi:hypothetical protein
MMMLKFCFCFFLEEDNAAVELVAFFGALGALGAMADGGEEGGVLKFAAFAFGSVDFEDGSPNAVAIMALATGS